MATRRGPAKTSPLSRERIVQAALKIADDEGLEALTMRRLGSALGVEAMSLYGHVQNKDALLDLVQEAVLAELEPITLKGDWRVRLREAAHAYRRVLGCHPHLLPLFASRWVRTPQAMASVEPVLKLLRETGLSDLHCAYAFEAFAAYVVGQALGQWGDRRQLTRDQFIAEHMQQLSRLPLARFPALAEVLPVFERFEFEDNFEFGLQCLLDGLERRIAAARP